MSHTRGPWVATMPPELNNEGGDSYYFIDAGFEATGSPMETAGFHIAAYLTEADASLIAAAPDLLEACKIMHQMLVERGCKNLAGTNLGENAIAKAEGQ